MDRGRARGEQLWLNILHSHEQNCDPDDAELLRLRNKLAVFYATTGQNRKALPLYLRNLADRERVLGPEHEDTLLSRSNLAICHESLGDHDAAAGLLAPLHEQRARLLGRDHADTLDTLDRYAMCLYRMRAYREAERQFALLVEARTRIGGPDDRARTRYLSWVGWSRYRAGHRRRALEAMRASLADRERILGGDHADTMLARHAVGGVLACAAPPRRGGAAAGTDPGRPDKDPGSRRTGHREDALAAGEDARRDRAPRREHGAATREPRGARPGPRGRGPRFDPGPDAPRGRRARRRSVTLTALACYADALGLAERIFGPEHPDTVTCRFSVATRLLGGGSPDEAIPLFERVLENYRRNHGDDDERTLKVRRDLARCHDSAGRHERALEDYRALLTDARRVLLRSNAFRRSLTADLAAAPVASWWNREVLGGRRLWQVALGAVVVAEALDTGYTADVLYKRRWLAKSETAAALRKSRGIASRDDLLRSLRDAADPASVSARTIARYVDTVRDGVVAGHLEEPEAWELLEQITEPTALAYDSWADFTADYLAGCAGELGLSGPPRPDWPTGHRRRIEAVDRLLDPRDDDSPFHRAPWNAVRTAPAAARAPVAAPAPASAPHQHQHP